MTLPARRMLDGSPCWCVSADAPHHGWVHAPACLARRGAFPYDPDPRHVDEIVPLPLARPTLAQHDGGPGLPSLEEFLLGVAFALALVVAAALIAGRHPGG